MKISISNPGGFDKTSKFFTDFGRIDLTAPLKAGAEAGLRALRSATPQDSGLAESSWGYTIEKTSKSATIHWTNSDIENGFPVAVMIQYGHGTGTGGFVQGIDYINPALRPIFEKIANDLWKAVRQ